MAIVKCLFCEERFDREKEPCVKIGRRYAHKKCAEQEDPKLVNDEQEKEQFYQIVKSIFGPHYNFVLINKQAKEYIKQYHYTWSGMAACLHWFYNINHNNPDDGNGGIGIIPYIYEQVKEYYKQIYEAQKRNKTTSIKREVLNFNIQSPRANWKPPQLIDF